MTVLSTRQLNRALLARQMLLERSTAPIPRVLERMGGLPGPIRPGDLCRPVVADGGPRAGTGDRRLWRDEQIVQGTMMRSTIHVVSASDYWPLMVATRRRPPAVVRPGLPGPLQRGRLLAAAETVRQPARLRPQAQVGARRRGRQGPMGRVGIHLDMVRVPPSGTWERRRADLYGLAEQWIPPTSDNDRSRPSNG